jgi:hypothetical protein
MEMKAASFLFAALTFISLIFRYEILYAKYVDLLDKLKEAKKSQFFSTVKRWEENRWKLRKLRSITSHKKATTWSMTNIRSRDHPTACCFQSPGDIAALAFASPYMAKPIRKINLA